MNPIGIIAIILAIILLGGVRVVFEYKRALKFRFGKYIKILKPGLRWIIPIVETVQFVDIRVITIKDFRKFIHDVGLKILNEIAINTHSQDRYGKIIKFLPNMRATYGIFLIS